jgi:hypothetical protein
VAFAFICKLHQSPCSQCFCFFFSFRLSLSCFFVTIIILHDKLFIECEGISQMGVHLSQQLIYRALARIFALEVHDVVSDRRLHLFINCGLWMEHTYNMAHVTVQHITKRGCSGRHGHWRWNDKEQQFSTRSRVELRKLVRHRITTRSYVNDHFKFWRGPSFYPVHENRRIGGRT